MVMFRGDGQSVEENQEDDQPVENLWLNSRPTLPPEQSVPPARVPTAQEGGEIEAEGWGNVGGKWDKKVKIKVEEKEEERGHMRG